MKDKKINVLVVDAQTFLKSMIDTSIALDVVNVGSNIDRVRSKLIELYGADAVVTADGKSVAVRDIKAADEIEADGKPDFDKDRYGVADAVRVIDRLMQKPGGCPWDSVQTHESIRINMIEEAYEAVDAIDKHDIENMREEFGDVLLQSLLQSAIARREGEFDFAEVCDELCKKLIARHTFIFGADAASDPEEAIALWDRNKAVEKKYVSVKDQLSRLPETFPALLYCQKVHKKSKKAGVEIDPKSDLDGAISCADYVKVIAACVALLSDAGRDAEVELNKYVKSRISEL